MRFQRRRSTWPYAAGLVLIFLLTLAAPWSWQRLARRPATRLGNSPDVRVAAAGSDARASSAPQRTAAKGAPPVLPPLLDLNLTDPAEISTSTSAPLLGPPPVRSDDYDDYATDSDDAEDSLYSVEGERPISQASSLLGPSLPPSIVERVGEGEAAPTSSSSSPTATPPAPLASALEPRLDVERLLTLRDKLWSLLKSSADQEASSPTRMESSNGTTASEQPRSSQPSELQPVARALGGVDLGGSEPRVQVASEHDRLAMAIRIRPPSSRPIVAPPRTWSTSTDRISLHVPQWVTPRLAQRVTRPAPTSTHIDASVDVEMQSDASLGSSASPWSRPESLIAYLETSVDFAAASPWRKETLDRLERLTASPFDGEQTAHLLDDLELLATRGMNDALQASNPAEQRAWLRGCRALTRRLPLWRAMSDPEVVQRAASPVEPSHELTRRILHEVESSLGGSEHAEQWRAYLRLDALVGLASVGGNDDAQLRRSAAREVLARLASSSLTEAQQAFLGSRPFSALAGHLRGWASGPVDLAKLDAIVERYELKHAPRDADLIAEAMTRLQFAADYAPLAEVSRQIDVHYRNANVRFAVSDEMFNRFVPKQQTTTAPVHDRVAGAEVHGRSQVETQVRCRFHPDVQRWRLELEARGAVHSKTYSDKWPARLRNAGNLEFQAHKLILVGRDGVKSLPAEARARGTTKLIGVDTHFDPLPLVGDLFQGVARQRHREREPLATAQAKSKVAQKARDQLDKQTDERLRRLDEQFRTALLVPLEELALAADPVDMYTTAKRAVMRLRMADVEQLAANTPRPIAPSDSLVSFQLHESALNNAIAGLHLDGERMTVDELHRRLAQRLRLASTEPPEDLPHQAVIEFAAGDAVTIRCDGDHIRLTLSIREMVLGRDAIRSVDVHAFFQPEIDGLGARLVRSGTLQFSGPRLRTGTRMVLHGVFNKLIRKDAPLEIIGGDLKSDPRWQGVMVTQLVIEDGWIALALGPASPERTAWRTGEVIIR